MTETSTPLPRLSGDPAEETFADFWIAYQYCPDENGEWAWEQVYYGSSKNEVLAKLQAALRGLGLKKRDEGERCYLHRDGTPLFCVLHQLLNYGWFDAGEGPQRVRERVPLS